MQSISFFWIYSMVGRKAVLQGSTAFYHWWADSVKKVKIDLQGNTEAGREICSKIGLRRHTIDSLLS